MKVGRADGCDLAVMDASVSRNHATLTRGKGGQFTVANPGSGNGTFVNGKRVAAPRSLAGGDELRFGSVRFQLELMEEPAPVTSADATLVRAEDPQGDATCLTPAPVAPEASSAPRAPVSGPVPAGRRQVASSQPESSRGPTRALPAVGAPVPAPAPPSPVRAQLAPLGLVQYATRFEAAGLTPGDFPALTDAKLRSLGVVSPEHRRVLLQEAARVAPSRGEDDEEAEELADTPPPTPRAMAHPPRAMAGPPRAVPAPQRTGPLGLLVKLFKYWVMAVRALFVAGLLFGVVVSATRGGSSSGSSSSGLPERNPGEELSQYCDRTYRPTFQLCCDKVGGSFGGSGCSYGMEQEAFFACVHREQDAVGCKGHEPSRGGGGASGGSSSRRYGSAESCYEDGYLLQGDASLRGLQGYQACARCGGSFISDGVFGKCFWAAASPPARPPGRSRESAPA